MLKLNLKKVVQQAQPKQRGRKVQKDNLINYDFGTASKRQVAQYCDICDDTSPQVVGKKITDTRCLICGSIISRVELEVI